MDGSSRALLSLLLSSPLCLPASAAVVAPVPVSAPVVPVAPASVGLAAPSAARATLTLPEAPAGLRPTLAAPPAVSPELRGLETARAQTARESARLLEMRKAGVQTSAVLASNDTKTIIEYRGVPSRVEPLNPSGKVFRHWTRSEDSLRSILESGRLVAGPVSYVEFTGDRRAYIKEIFLDLGGVFFTTPQYSSEEPRVMNEKLSYYVDFTIPEGVAALSLDGEQVLMIPAKTLGAEGVPIQIVGSSRR